MHVKEIMSHPVVTCPESSTLDHAARLMWEYDLGVVPVIDQDGRVSGIVTDRDICMAAYTQGRTLAEMPVSGAMARRIVACHVDDTIESVERLMAAEQLHRLPVLDAQDRAIGVVSLNDLARLAARAHRSTVDRELVDTLASVCRPRQPHVPMIEPQLTGRRPSMPAPAGATAPATAVQG